ncbi:hypothetical protein CBL_09689 [Carabus blaptoides fortunei]
MLLPTTTQTTNIDDDDECLGVPGSCHLVKVENEPRSIRCHTLSGNNQRRRYNTLTQNPEFKEYQLSLANAREFWEAPFALWRHIDTWSVPWRHVRTYGEGKGSSL